MIGKVIDGSEDFLSTPEQARNVLGWAEEETPGASELVWTRVAGRSDQPPEGFESLGEIAEVWTERGRAP